MVPLLSRLSSRLRGSALVLGGIALGVGVAVGASALANGNDDAGPAALGRPALPEGSQPLLDPTRLAEVEGPRTRAASPQAAVEAFLSAEQAADREASFGYLTDPVRVDYGSPAAWAADHPDVLAPVTGFELVDEPPVEQGQSAQVATLTSYRSSLDSVAGFVPAQARTFWVTVREDDGWAVDVLATTQQTVFPPDDEALAVVQAWAQELQRCGTPEVYVGGVRGRTDLADQLCDASGDVRAATVSPLQQVDAGPLQSSFGADAIEWARTVTLEGPVPLRAVVAPLDGSWTVVGVLTPGAGG